MKTIRIPINRWVWDGQKKVILLDDWPDRLVLQCPALGESPPYTLALGGSSGRGRSLWSTLFRRAFRHGGPKTREEGRG